MTDKIEDNADLLAPAAVAPSVEGVESAPEAQAEEVLLSSLIKDESLKNSATVQKFKDVDSIVKSYEELQSKLGSRVQDLSAEDLKALDSKFDVPESIDGYDFEEIQGNETVDTLRKAIAEAGISKAQGENFDKVLRETVKLEDQNKQHNDGIALADARSKLKAQYGLAYEEKMNVATEALNEIADEEQLQYFRDKGFTRDPEFMKALVKVGEIIGEDKLEFNSKSREFGIQPSEVQHKIDDMKSRNSISEIVRNPELKKQWANLHKMKAQYKNLVR
jgi:hypothetical protein